MSVVAASCLAYPLSRGTIHVKSADPFEQPTIDPAFLSHPADAAVLAAGIKVGWMWCENTTCIMTADTLARCPTRSPIPAI